MSEHKHERQHKGKAPPPAGETAPDAPGATASAGAALRQKRQMRGLSLEAVHQATRVPRQLLQALEEDRYADFPAPVYLRGFLKTYCDHLDLEFEPLWQRVMPPAPSAERAPERAPTPPRPLEPPRAFPAAAFLAAFAAVVVLVWGVTRLSRPRTVEEPRGAPPPEIHEPAPEPTVPVPEPAAETPRRLRVTAVSDAWVSLRRDGQLVFEGRLPKAKHLDWGGSAFLLHASDPRALRVELGTSPVDLGAIDPGPGGAYRIEGR